MESIVVIALLYLFLYVRSVQYKELNTRLKDGLQKYNPNLRPVYNFSEPLEVSLYVFLNSLIEVKENENSIRSVVYVTVMWKDEIFEKDILKSLCVDKDCGFVNDRYFAVDSKTIWIPDLRLFNSRTKMNLRTEADVVMAFSGQGFLARSGLFETFCSIEAQKYPFDEQECFYEFGAGISTVNHMTINTENINIMLDYYEPNGEWNLKSSETYIYNGHELPRYRYVIRLKRRSTLILLSMVIPTSLISLTGTLCFI